MNKTKCKKRRTAPKEFRPDNGPRRKKSKRKGKTREKENKAKEKKRERIKIEER